jgi:hypothetical protein
MEKRASGHHYVKIEDSSEELDRDEWPRTGPDPRGCPLCVDFRTDVTDLVGEEKGHDKVEEGGHSSRCTGF